MGYVVCVTGCVMGVVIKVAQAVSVLVNDVQTATYTKGTLLVPHFDWQTESSTRVSQSGF